MYDFHGPPRLSAQGSFNCAHYFASNSTSLDLDLGAGAHSAATS